MHTEPANRITHFVLVADASYSMTPHKNALPKVVDTFVADMAGRSTELGQETRITVYTFNGTEGIKCLIYDMDVLRRPSIDGRYIPSGRTPLIDATFQAIDELEETPERYGEHSFVVYVWSDGLENESRVHPLRRGGDRELHARIAGLPGHWTVAAFVPNQNGILEAKRCGFPAGNIEVWDTTSSRGFAEAGERIRAVSMDFMQARTQGVRGSKSLFTVSQVTPQVAAANLTPLPPGSYRFEDVQLDGQIRDLVERATGRVYVKGSAYYQLTKPETVQPYKQVAIEVPGGQVYTGPAARQLLGLPDYEVKVQPEYQPGTKIFVQSTSVNRRLTGGTRVLILTR